MNNVQNDAFLFWPFADYIMFMWEKVPGLQGSSVGNVATNYQEAKNQRSAKQLSWKKVFMRPAC